MTQWLSKERALLRIYLSEVSQLWKLPRIGKVGVWYWSWLFWQQTAFLSTNSNKLHRKNATSIIAFIWRKCGKKVREQERRIKKNNSKEHDWISTKILKLWKFCVEIALRRFVNVRLSFCRIWFWRPKIEEKFLTRSHTFTLVKWQREDCWPYWMIFFIQNKGISYLTNRCFSTANNA